MRKLLYALALIFGLYAPAYSQEIVIGDSLACGLKTAGHLQGGCKVGASPMHVAEMVATYPSDLYKNQIVILSCGVSNNPAQIEFCLRDMDFIAERGGRIVLLGVGVAIPGSYDLNELLKAYADVHDAIFIWGWHDVHPADYSVVLKLARSEECKYWRVCET